MAILKEKIIKKTTTFKDLIKSQNLNTFPLTKVQKKLNKLPVSLT